MYVSNIIKKQYVNCYNFKPWSEDRQPSLQRRTQGIWEGGTAARPQNVVSARRKKGTKMGEIGKKTESLANF